MNNEESQIQKFYKSQNVFLTGGTGFLGKILIEKLLRSSEVSTLYILIREKKGKNALSRIEELFDDIIFDRLKKECPKFKHRIEAIPGDCSISGLGVSITDRQKLISNVHIVFHVAATVRFDENLKLAYQINVNATKDVLDLSRQMTNLKSIVHVSTAYSNCPRTVIEEKIYDCPVSYEDLGAVLEKISRKEAEMLTKRIIGKWPNTYTFTKALAESLIKDVGGGLPLAIFRPSVVLSTYKEPIPGWIDNLYGPNGSTAGVFSGVLRVVPCDESAVGDVIPVDTCVAALIATGWDVANNENPRTVENIPVYNYVSCNENPLTWQEFSEINFSLGKQYPCSSLLWAPVMMLTKNPIVYSVLKFFLHIVPAIIIDTALILTMNRPRMMQMYRKIHKFTELISYFCMRSWQFSNKNTINLWHKMNTADREIFSVSMSNVHWLIYMRTYIQGVRRYLLKDPDSTLEEARKKHRRIGMLNSFIKILLIFLTCQFFMTLLYKLYNFF